MHHMPLFDVVPVIAGALVFASAKNPGGGFLNGSIAQEESIALCSALYACQTRPDVHAGFYQYHASHYTPVYTDRIIFSPAVPVFRDDASLELLEQPFNVDLLTCAAVNAGVAKEKGLSSAAIDAALERRVECVLAVAAHVGVTHLVLGAFGCGVFRNDARKVAAAFSRALGSARYMHAFASVVFAVPESHDRNSSAFKDVFPE